MNTQISNRKGTIIYNAVWVVLLTGLFFLAKGLHTSPPDYYVIDGGTFDQNVYVFITEDTTMVREYSPNMDFNSAGCTVGGDIIMVWFPKKPDAGLLAHEMTHVTEALLVNVGVPHSEDTEEVYAYEVQYLINKFGNIK